MQIIAYSCRIKETPYLLFIYVVCTLYNVHIILQVCNANGKFFKYKFIFIITNIIIHTSTNLQKLNKILNQIRSSEKDKTE